MCKQWGFVWWLPYILYNFFIDNEETIAKFDFEEFFDSKRQLMRASSGEVEGIRTPALFDTAQIVLWQISLKD